MKAESKAIFLAKRNYTKTDKTTGELWPMIVYTFLVYEDEEAYGISNPEVKKMIVTERDKNEVAENLKIYEKCKVIFDVVNGREGKTYFVPVDCIKITK